MSQRLKNILAVTNLAAGASAVLPHNLHTSVGRPLAPDIVYIPTPDLEVTASTTASVTVKNNGSSPVSGNVLVEAWHTIERSFNDVNEEDLPVKPYVVVSVDAALNAPVSRIVYRPGDPLGTHDNVYVTWAEAYAAVQSVINRGQLYLEFDDHFVTPVVIPAGTWNLPNVIWTNAKRSAGAGSAGLVFVKLDDGARITAIQPTGVGTDREVLQIEGYGLSIQSDRKGPVAPFTGIQLLFTGVNTRIFNTDPTALPMIVRSGISNGIYMSSSCRGRIGSSGGPCPAPVIDATGGGYNIFMGAGELINNALGDTVGGGFYQLTFNDDAANGLTGFNNLDFPTLAAAGGTFGVSVQHRDRFYIEPGTIVDPSLSPWEPFSNEFVRVDPATGPVTVIAPPGVLTGERFGVKDFTGWAGTNNIIIQPQGSDIVDSPVIDQNTQAKVWVCDGEGRWMLMSEAVSGGIIL